MTDKEMLDKLVQERKEIDRKIRELRGKEKTIGCAKFDKYTCGYCDEYYVAVKRINFDNLENYEPRYMPIIVAKEKRGVMCALYNVISDLQGLYESMKEKEDISKLI